MVCDVRVFSRTSLVFLLLYKIGIKPDRQFKACFVLYTIMSCLLTIEFHFKNSVHLGKGWDRKSAGTWRRKKGRMKAGLEASCPAQSSQPRPRLWPESWVPLAWESAAVPSTDLVLDDEQSLFYVPFPPSSSSPLIFSLLLSFCLHFLSLTIPVMGHELIKLTKRTVRVRSLCPVGWLYQTCLNAANEKLWSCYKISE